MGKSVTVSRGPQLDECLREIENLNQRKILKIRIKGFSRHELSGIPTYTENSGLHEQMFLNLTNSNQTLSVLIMQLSCINPSFPGRERLIYFNSSTDCEYTLQFSDRFPKDYYTQAPTPQTQARAKPKAAPRPSCWGTPHPERTEAGAETPAGYVALSSWPDLSAAKQPAKGKTKPPSSPEEVLAEEAASPTVSTTASTQASPSLESTLPPLDFSFLDEVDDAEEAANAGASSPLSPTSWPTLFAQPTQNQPVLSPSKDTHQRPPPPSEAPPPRPW